jgi:ketosteroid isomerase-like protein
MGISTPVRVVRSFIDRINAHDMEGLARLMTPRHRFTDALGASGVGRRAVREGWEAYLRWFPDYQIDVEASFSSGDLVAVFGTASGSFEGRPGAHGGDRFVQPAAWLARVTRGQVVGWAVFTDTAVPSKILHRHGLMGSRRRPEVGRKLRSSNHPA